VSNSATALQYTINTAEDVTGTSSYLGNPGMTIEFGPGKFLINTQINITGDGLSIFGSFGLKTLLYCTSEIKMFKIGDDSYSTQTYFGSFNGIQFHADSTIADSTTSKAIEAHDCISWEIENCTFNNFAYGVDGYRLNTCYLEDLIFKQHNRDSGDPKAISAISLKGRSTDGSTSGNNHISDIQIFGSGLTEDMVFTHGLFIASADGLYLDNSHIYKCDNDITINPDGTNVGNIIAAILVTNTYFDQANTRCLNIVGSTANAGGGVTKTGFYQNISFVNCYFRGGAVQDSGVTYVPFLVGISVSSVSSNGLKNITFERCNFRQAKTAALISSGTASGKVEVDNLQILDCIFSDNAADGAVTNSAITGEVISTNVSGNTFKADLNASTRYVQFNISSASMTSQVTNNDLANGNCTSDPISITPAEGSNINVSDNAVPGEGSVTKQIFKSETNDATTITLFSRTINDNTTGFIKANIIGFDSDSGNSVAYELEGHFQRDGTAALAWIGGSDPIQSRASESGTATACDAILDFSSTLVRVRITGLASTTINWVGDIYLIQS
jgi:hypothetical protein